MHPEQLYILLQICQVLLVVLIFGKLVLTDGTYGLPENLGADINTESDENFPFIADNNVLYFHQIDSLV
jgi:hypothetical protein